MKKTRGLVGQKTRAFGRISWNKEREEIENVLKTENRGFFRDVID